MQPSNRLHKWLATNEEDEQEETLEKYRVSQGAEETEL